MKKSIVLLTLAIAAMLLGAETALAQGGEDIGGNVGKLLGGWATELYVGVIAIVAIVFLFSKRYVELAVFCVAALVVGIFVTSPESVSQAAQGIGDTVLGN
ncbi:MAG: hypothetical protein M3R12_04510 [Actinomycetota bacterium]|jgi:hypothetical protein|nr:hypothetical protein [Actinomycetota bacterium]